MLTLPQLAESNPLGASAISRQSWSRAIAFYIPATTVALFALVTMVRRSMTFDADALWLFSFVHDLRNDVPIAGWTMPGAPLFFPDLVSVLAWTALHLSVAGSLLVHGVVSWLLVGGTIFEALCLAGLRRSLALDAAFLALLLYIFAFGDSHVVAAFQFPIAHGGATLATLIGLVFLGKGIHDGYRCSSGVLAAASIGLIVASDRAVVAQFVLPAAVSALLALGFRHAPRRHALSTIGILAGGSALGWAATHLIGATSGIQPTPLAFDPSWTSSADTFSLILEELLNLAQQHPLVLVCVLLPSGVLLFVASKGLSPGARRDATPGKGRAAVIRWWLAVAASMTVLATLAAPVVTHRWAPRYILPAFILPLGISIVVVAPRIEALGARAVRVLQLAMLVVLAVLAADRTSQVAPLNPYAPAHACLDRLALQERLSAGYAGYWHARPAMVMGHNQLTVTAVSGPLILRRWMDNVFWSSRGYDNNDERPPNYDFVITNGMDEVWIESRFGAPRARETCFGLEIWIYDRPTDLEFRNFVRTRVAHDTHDSEGWWESTTLARARSEGLSRLGFDGDGGMLLDFGGVGAGNAIEIASTTQQPLEVRYQLKGQDLARQEIDFRLDARRILPLPEIVVRRGFDSVLLHGLPGVRYEIEEAVVMIDGRAELAEH